MKILLILFFASCVVAKEIKYPFEPLVVAFNTKPIKDYKRVNELTDKALQAIKILIETDGLLVDYSPMILPDVIANYSTKLPVKQFHGAWELTNGQAFGFDSYERCGNASLSYDEHFFRIKVQVQFDYILFKYKHLVKIINLEQEVVVVIDGFVVLFDVLIDRHHKSTYYINDMDFEVNGSIKVKVKETNLLNWGFNRIVEYDTSPFYEILNSTIFEQFQRDCFNLAEIFNSS